MRFLKPHNTPLIENRKLSFWSTQQQAYGGYPEERGPGSEPPQTARLLTSPVKWGCLSSRVPG